MSHIGLKDTMENQDKKKLILDFINGPLRTYLQGEVSFGRFKELINEQFYTDFHYAELYPSYLFNAQISYPAEDKEAAAYSQRLSECHAYGLCVTGDPYPFPCKICPQKKRE